MCQRSNSRTEGEGRMDGSIRLSPQETAELRRAIRQMDLLLQTRHVEYGLRCLVAMLRSLQALRRAVFP